MLPVLPGPWQLACHGGGPPLSCPALADGRVVGATCASVGPPCEGTSQVRQLSWLLLMPILGPWALRHGVAGLLFNAQAVPRGWIQVGGVLFAVIGAQYCGTAWSDWRASASWRRQLLELRKGLTASDPDRMVAALPPARFAPTVHAPAGPLPSTIPQIGPPSSTVPLPPTDSLAQPGEQGQQAAWAAAPGQGAREPGCDKTLAGQGALEPGCDKTLAARLGPAPPPLPGQPSNLAFPPAPVGAGRSPATGSAAPLDTLWALSIDLADEGGTTPAPLGSSTAPAQAARAAGPQALQRSGLPAAAAAEAEGATTDTAGQPSPPGPCSPAAAGAPPLARPPPHSISFYETTVWSRLAVAVAFCALVALGCCEAGLLVLAAINAAGALSMWQALARQRLAHQLFWEHGGDAWPA
jgi:hypothetical protein